MPNRVSYTFSLVGDYIAKAKKVARETRSIRLGMRALNRTAKIAGRGVAGAFGLMKKAALGLKSSMAPLLAAFAGVAGAVKFFTLGVGFETAMLDLQAITGAAGDELEFLKESALSMGKAARFSAAETAEAFQLVASAKPELLKNTELLAATTEQVLLLANASGLDLATASETVGETLNQFGLEAGEAGRLVNVLAAGAKLGSSLIPETGRALREVGGIANEAGISLETTNAAIQLIALGGIKGTKAGTQLKGALLGLAASGIRKITPSIVGMEQALFNLKEMQLTEQQQIKLFGRENLQTGQILTRSAGDLKRLTEEMTGTNIATEQAKIRMSGFSSRLKGLGATIGNAVIRAFERLAPVFEEVITNMEKFFDSITVDDIKKFADEMKPIVQLMIDLAGAAIAAAQAIAPVVGFFAKGGVSGILAAKSGLLGDTSANNAGLKEAAGGGKAALDVKVQFNDPASTVSGIQSSSTGQLKDFVLKTGINLKQEFDAA